MNSAWVPAEGERRTASPAVDICETKDAVIIQAEMAGVGKDDIRLDLEGDTLTLCGKPRCESLPDGYTPVYREREPLEYRRSFVLGAEVRRDKIDAKFADGVLRVTLGKQQRPQPRKVPIE